MSMIGVWSIPARERVEHAVGGDPITLEIDIHPARLMGSNSLDIAIIPRRHQAAAEGGGRSRGPR
jgi:hypothetical protein